jgi:DNA-binding transcriptional MerR regulator
VGDRLTVGAVARRVGVTPKTVRYYEARGLLPEPARGDNGYRYYTAETLNRLVFIRRAKLLGLSLAEISDLVSIAEHGQCDRTQAELGSILAQKIVECTRQIEDLIQFRATLEGACQELVMSRADAAEAARDSSMCAGFDPACGCLPVTVEVHT